VKCRYLSDLFSVHQTALTLIWWTVRSGDRAAMRVTYTDTGSRIGAAFGRVSVTVCTNTSLTRLFSCVRQRQHTHF